MNAGTEYLIAVASVIDHHAPAPTQDLRTAILSAIRSLTTVSEVERSLIRQYLFLEASGEGTANLAFEDAFPVGPSPLLEHMRVSRLARTRFLKQLRDHPSFPFGIEHQQQDAINLATMFIPVREHLRLAPLMQAQAQPDFLDMMATQYQKAALLLEAGWAIRDYHTLHATPPPSMEALRTFLSSQDSYAIDLELLDYELLEQGYRLQIIETIDWLPEVDEDFPMEDEEEAMTLEDHTSLTWLGHGSSPHSISGKGDGQ